MEEYHYSEEEIDLRGLFEVLWRRKWLILAIIVISVAIAGYLSFFAIPPVYEAEALIELRFPEQVKQQEAYRLQILDPYFLSQVIEKLELDHHNYTPFSLRKGLGVDVIKNIDFLETPDFLEIPTFLKITVKDGDPQKATDIANAIASEFVDFAIRSTQEDVKKELLFLEEGMKEWNSKVNEVGRKRKDFLVQSEIANLEKETEAKRNLLGSFQRDLVFLDIEEKELQATLEKAKEKLESEPPYLKLRQSLFGSSEEEDMVGDFISGFLPLTMEREAANEVYNALKGQVMSLEAQLSGMEARKKTMIEAAGEVQIELKELESTLLEKAIERDQLQREYDSILGTYDYFIQEYGKTQVYSMSEEVNAGVRIVSSALPPKEPISPRKMLNVAIAGVLGIFVGIIAAFVAEYWGKTAPSTEG